MDFLLDLRDSGTAPQALEDRPVIHEWMVEYLEGFQALNRTRKTSMGLEPIQYSEVLAFLTIFGASDVRLFIKYVLAMDETYLGVMAKKKPSESATPDKPKEPGSDGGQSSNPKRQQRRRPGSNGR